VIVTLPGGHANASLAMTLPPPGASGPDAALDQGVLKSMGRSDTDLYGPLRDAMMSAGFATSALKVGDAAPDFFLPDESAHLVPLTELLAKGPVVIVFLGGSWCSFCISKARALIAAVRGHGATLVALTPETGPFPRAMKAAHNLDCVLLCDVDYGVGLQFGVIYAPPPQIVAQMNQRGLDLAGIHGVVKPMLPAPAVYVIAPSGKITCAQIDLDYTIPVNPAPILEVLG
jgi:peroxiredoxin